MRPPGGQGREAAIVGGGIFGSIIGAALADAGWSVIIIDDPEARQRSGSRPAACLMADGWLSGLSKEERALGFDLLEKLYGLQHLTFSLMGPNDIGLKTMSVKWVPPKDILSTPRPRVLRIDGRVSEPISPYGPHPEVRYFSRAENVLAKHTLKCDLLVVAAGIHTSALWPQRDKLLTKGRAGVAFTWQTTGRPSFVKPFLPYRQMVGFQREPGEYWMGDGMALKESSVTRDRVNTSLERLAKQAGLDPVLAEGILGVRPYPLEKLSAPCDMLWCGPQVVGVTGGGKNGTIAAAWAAAEILRQV